MGGKEYRIYSSRSGNAILLCTALCMAAAYVQLDRLGGVLYRSRADQAGRGILLREEKLTEEGEALIHD